jgi:hypothetical protein
LVHAIVGKSAITDKWTNDVLAAHLKLEMANLGRLILQWIFQYGVTRGRDMICAKNQDAADGVAIDVETQEECFEMAKRTGTSKESAGVTAELDAKADRTVSIS